MSFSQKVKNEIMGYTRDTDALISMVCGEILSAGSLVILRHQISFMITSENEAFVSVLKKQLVRAFQIDENRCGISIDNSGLKSRFELEVGSDDGARILEMLGIIYRDKQGDLRVNRIPSINLLADDECKCAYLSGAFCGAGSISIPNYEKNGGSGYHMEWVCQSPERAGLICNLLGELGIISKKIERGASNVVYLKESDGICQILARMGAVASMLELENNRVEREVRNNINRQSNCQSANLDKTVNASVKQMQAIDIISNTIGLESLPDNLAEVALARAANPQASLAEIVKILGGKISRVAVGQRLSKLIKLAQDLGENDG